jgi:hypothetical protein
MYNYNSFIDYYYYYYYYLLTAVEFSLGDSSPYTSTDKTNRNKYTYTNQYRNTIQTIQHNKYKHTYYQNTHTIVQTPHTLHNPHTHTHTHTLQNRLKHPQYKITHQMKYSQ